MKSGLAAEKGIDILVVSDKGYAQKVEELMRSASSSYSRICYATVNRPYSAIAASFKKHGADLEKFFFVDCTGESGGKGGQVVFVSSPKALTEINITINKVFELGKIELLIFDSLSTLLSYEEPSTVVKFAHSLISSCRSKGVGALFVCLKSEKSSSLLKDISMFADNVVEK